jgi:hypothetical protein
MSLAIVEFGALRSISGWDPANLKRSTLGRKREDVVIGMPGSDGGQAKVRDGDYALMCPLFPKIAYVRPNLPFPLLQASPTVHAATRIRAFLFPERSWVGPERSSARRH